MSVPVMLSGSTKMVKTPKNSKNWGLVVLLLIFFTMNFADKAAVGLASEQIRESMNLNAAQYGMLSSAFFWLFAVGAVVLTAVLKRISYNWAAGILMLTWIMSMLPVTVPTTFGVLLTSRILLGFFESPAHALVQSILHERFPPEKRALAGAIVNSGSSVGPLLAAPALTWVILTWDWHASFILLSAISVLWLIVWMAYADKLPFFKPKGGVHAKQDVYDSNADINVPFSRLLMSRSFWGLAALSFSGYLISSLKVTWLPSFLHEGLGYSTEMVGLLVPIPYAVAIVILISAGIVSGRLLKKGYSSRVARSFLTAGFLLFSGVCMMLFAELPPGPLQLAMVVAAFSINSVAFTIGFAGASDFLPARQRTAFFGCIIALYSVAGMIAPLGLGIVVELAATPTEGYANGFFVVGILICVFGVAGGLLLDPARERERLLLLTQKYEEEKAQRA
ncbi:MFS transporter [Arthrobacter sp. MYb213]|uniref:MFS transporter n=1 Tax=Arthrobacter sp. MYb213 TaxID=1848595 RepID=UPI001C6121FE|nr:MFS transporter [Arthrobacter sp. MYb213]